MRDPTILPYSMSVGKSKPNTKYGNCAAGSDNDNGCGADECIRGGDEKDRSGDYLLITGGIYTETKENDPVKHFLNDYYCGNGLGEDTKKDNNDLDGTDDGKGVFTQASGPVAIR